MRSSGWKNAEDGSNTTRLASPDNSAATDLDVGLDPTGAPFVDSPPLHDATFLNAVLPFALSQARRHNEALSLICVEIDRLAGIQELMGRAVADRLVQSVCETVAVLIRSSDIVARLDDDRIVAVLPRAPRGGALHVAKRSARPLSRRAMSATRWGRSRCRSASRRFPPAPTMCTRFRRHRPRTGPCGK